MDWRQIRYDAIVVGSGATGGMAAKSLTDGGASVLLLEAGPELPPETCKPLRRSNEEFAAIRARQPIQSRNLWYNKENCHLFIDDLENPYSTDTSTEFNWIRSRQAGGRTLVWSRFALRMSQEDFKSTDRNDIGISWPFEYADLAPFYDEVEALIGVQGTIETVPALPDGYFLPRKAPGYLLDLRKRVARRWPDRYLLPSREVVEKSLSAGSALPSFSSLGSTLLRCDPRKLTLRTNSVAARITMERPDRARGVVFIDRINGKWHEVEARTIVLCASTIESVRLLLASKDDNHPVGLGNSSGTLGRYLMDHFGGPRVVATGKVNHHGLPSVERVYLPRFCNLDGQSEEFLRGYGIQGEVQVLVGGAAVFSLGVFGEVLPYFENAVELDETIKDTVGLPVPRITFKYQDNEQRMAQHSAQALREILEAMEFRPSIVQDTVLTPGTRAHELGGARMGASPRTSVLNTYNQCWDISNLFVTDGACFPSASDKGPTLTMMALTRRTCEYILYQLKTGHL